MFDELTLQANKMITEFLAQTNLKPGSLLVIGCSTSEVLGKKIGSHSAYEAAEALLSGILPVLKQRGISLAAQCCEHLNRALVMEEETAIARGYDPVTVIPQPKAGGSFATSAYRNFNHPVVVEEIRADAGIDIGATLIGMHLKPVAVPLRLSVDKIGDAPLIFAYSRPKLIGGERAVYHE